MQWTRAKSERRMVIDNLPLHALYCTYAGCHPPMGSIPFTRKLLPLHVGLFTAHMVSPSHGLLHIPLRRMFCFSQVTGVSTRRHRGRRHQHPSTQRHRTFCVCHQRPCKPYPLPETWLPADSSVFPFLPSFLSLRCRYFCHGSSIAWYLSMPPAQIGSPLFDILIINMIDEDPIQREERSQGTHGMSACTSLALCCVWYVISSQRLEVD